MNEYDEENYTTLLKPRASAQIDQRAVASNTFARITRQQKRKAQLQAAENLAAKSKNKANKILNSSKVVKPVRAINLFENFIKDVMEKSKGYNPDVLKHPVLTHAEKPKPKLQERVTTIVHQTIKVEPVKEDVKHVEGSKSNSRYMQNSDIYDIEDF